MSRKSERSKNTKGLDRERDQDCPGWAEMTSCAMDRVLYELFPRFPLMYYVSANTRIACYAAVL